MSSPLQPDLKASSLQFRDSPGCFPLFPSIFGAWYIHSRMMNEEHLLGLTTVLLPEPRRNIKGNKRGTYSLKINSPPDNLRPHTSGTQHIGSSTGMTLAMNSAYAIAAAKSWSEGFLLNIS